VFTAGWLPKHCSEEDLRQHGISETGISGTGISGTTIVNSSSKRELLSLVEALCEETATPSELARLEELVLHDPDLRRLYVEAISLHGMLYWDAAGLGAEIDPQSGKTSAIVLPEGTWNYVSPERVSRKRRGSWLSRPRSYRRVREIVTGLVVLVILKLGFVVFSPRVPELAVAPENRELIEPPQTGEKEISPGPPLNSHLPVPDVRLSQQHDEAAGHPFSGRRVEESVVAVNPEAPISTFFLEDDAAVVDRINHHLALQWQVEKITPAPQASDAEWVRRIYLDLAGRIPTSREAEDFFVGRDSQKRAQLVDTLIASREFSFRLATIWTNLLVGRSRDRKIDREELLAWIEREFSSGRSWKETVTDLVAARGTARNSGPANFLLAHLNNEAVPATAITARIFLCEQLQCTQCHEHPTVKRWGQERFWELNAFFQQAGIRERRQIDPQSGKSRMVRELIDAEEFGPTYYETLRGVMRVAYPKFAGVEVNRVSEDDHPSLRNQLAELLFADARPQPARAFVNRTWALLMGRGFTNPVDDMGPHTPVSHPELLEDLTSAFVQSDYDVHRLVRWICLSDGYHLTSRNSSPGNIDAPELGERPLFSRMYVKPMSAEQLYDSLQIASGISPRILLDRQTQQAREVWLGQFYSAVDTEENGEENTFDGSWQRALMMMNGDLVQQATSSREGRVLADVITPHGLSEVDRIRQLSLAALSRYPSNAELSQLRDLLRRTIRQRVMEENLPPQLALAEGLKDVYWAYLNSSEFAMNR